jgi:hypothetical protein
VLECKRRGLIHGHKLFGVNDFNSINRGRGILGKFFLDFVLQPNEHDDNVTMYLQKLKTSRHSH